MLAQVSNQFQILQMQSSKKIIEEILQTANITLNGNKKYDLQVNDDRFYSKVLRNGSLGLGEAYMEEWWDCEDMQGFFNKLLSANLEKEIKKNLKYFAFALQARIFNQQSKIKSLKVAKEHYDLGNDVYELMLDKYMMYSCGYWKNAKNLVQAQEDKLELICRKLKLRPGLTVLEIGCGWGGFAQYAAERYNVKVIGITISKEQAKLARERCKGLPVEIRLQDYRELNEQFDRIVSIGMFEHVGPKNYKQYMEIAAKCLYKEGIFLLHCIGGNESTFSTDPWINKYIFPNGVIPSPVQVCDSFEKLFVLEDWHNFGLHYEKTLNAWLANFKGNWHFIESRYGHKFYRMWEYYLNVCAASFHVKKNNLWQIILTKPENLTEYTSIR